MARDAPSVRKRIEHFDEEVEHLLKSQGINEKDSLERARGILTDLRNSWQNNEGKKSTTS